MQEFANLAESVAATTRKSEKVALVSGYLRRRDAEVSALSARFLSGRALPAWEERTLQVGGALLRRTILDVSGQPEVKLTAAMRRHGDLGSAAHDVLLSREAPNQQLTVHEVADKFEGLANSRGPATKSVVLHELLGRATALEAKYVIKIITGELRIGFKESLVEEAISRAYDAPLDGVKRANMLLGDISETLRLASQSNLGDARMRLFHPIGFMLATPAEDAEEAFTEFSSAVIEDKYDGIRAQAHVTPVRASQEARALIYSRTLDEISGSFPELIPSLEGFADEVVLDGEILAWREGTAMPFSELQKRLGRKRVTEHMMQQIPVVYMVFDIIAHDESLVIDKPLERRRALLDQVFSRLERPKLAHASAQRELVFDTRENEVETRVLRAPSTVATSAEHLDDLFEAAQERGNEGLMIKDSQSLYTPGRRGRAWLKLKRQLATLDVVVTAVEFGNGRRASVLSDYTFAVRSGAGLVNVGKAYTGLTDTEIDELTEWFNLHTIADYGHVRTVEPKVVIEVAFNAVMRSDRHDSGFALRFPRIVRLRPDKPVSEIDDLGRVEQIYLRQVHLRKSA